jgi:vacuolar iron transporter family protein
MRRSPEADQQRSIGHSHRHVVGGWLRPAVFGMVDGLVSNFALVAGVAAAASTSTPVLLAGTAGLVGGALSMATGEYTSVQSQNESMQAEVAVERDELIYNTDAEVTELAHMYMVRGVDPELAQLVAEQLSVDVNQALEIHAQEELGVDINELPNARQAAATSFVSFSIGAFLPLVPFFFGASVLPIAAALALIGLFVTGALASRYTIRSWYYSGFRQVLFGLAAAAVTYGIGHLFNATVS